MHTRILIWLLFSSLVWATSSYGQPPNPPAGWEYVRNLDSLTVDVFHPVGDTIFMFGFDNHVSKKRAFHVVSYDGGASWDSVVIPTELPEGYQYGVFPTEAKMWLSHIIEEKRRFYISNDGKNYEWFEIGKDTTAGLGFTNFFIDPKDTNHWLVIGSFSLGLSKNSRLSQSFDAGRNWKIVNVPTAPAEKLTFGLIFDARRKGAWYVRVTAEPHIGQGTVLIERTTDNGETFEEVKQWGTHYSIGYPGEVRRWWGYSDRSFFGPMIGNENDDDLDSINWLKKFHPNLPTTSSISGYERWLTNPVKQYSGYYLFYPSNYITLRSDPLVAVIVEQEIKKDSITKKEEYTNSWIHQTSDDWETFNTLWESGPYEYASQIFLDEKEQKLWAITRFLSDTANSGNTGDRYKSYLYKRSLKLFVRHTQGGAFNEPLRVYPSPSNGSIKVLLPNTTSNVLSLQLSTVEGVVICRTKDEFFFSQGLVEWSIPENIPSGLYFLKIYTNNSPYLVKVILQRQ